MIRKTIFTSLFLFVAVVSTKAITSNTAKSDTTLKTIKKTSAYFPDSLFIPEIALNPLNSYQNLVYKRRLDSLH
ncbi:MAG: hypothetical protein WBP45_08890, partial [Daejeonella sp.]